MSDAVLPSMRPSMRPSPSLGWKPTWPPVRGLPRPTWSRLDVRTAAALATLVVALLLLAVAGRALVRLHTAGTVAPASAPIAAEWIDVPRPIHIFDLEAPLLRGSALVYTARRRTAGDGREDVLAYGIPGRDASLRLRLTRRTGGAAPPPPLFAVIASQAADAGLSVGRAGLAYLMPTRFGRFEIADVALTDGSVSRVACRGFRLALEAPAFTMSGLACGAPGQPMTREALACLVDRLDLASGGDDRAMIDFFAASERRRNPDCAGAGLAPDAMHAAWLDDKPVTHLRTSRRH